MKILTNTHYWLLGLSLMIINSVQVNGQFVQDQELSDMLTNISNGDVLWGDYDADGDLDILIAGNSMDSLFTGIYRNDGLNFSALNLNFVSLENANLSWCDFDNDNDLDFMITGTDITDTVYWPSAFLYQNIGGDNFEINDANIQGVFDGKSVWGDLDNDGDQDLVMIGDKGGTGVTRIYQNLDLTTFEIIDHNLLNVYNGDVAIGDYDNDMDLDILMIGVTINSIGEEDKVLNLYRNEGDFNFVNVLSGFVGMSESNIQWADYDSDGNLDIIANGSTEAPTYLVYLYQNLKNDNFLNIGIEIFGTINGSVNWGDYDVDGDLDFLLTGMPSYLDDPISEIYRNIDVNLFNKDDDLDIVEVHESDARWGDYDNDGDLDILMSGFQTTNDNPISVVYDNQIEASNTTPSIPLNLHSTVIGNSVILNWANASDYETPDNGLTYSILVGTESGQCDIVSSMSNSVGKLLVPQLGNVNHNKSWELKNLAPGNYFWSVQSIDNNFEGSAFAEEESFEIITSVASDVLLLVNSNRPLINSYPNPFSEKITFEVITSEKSVLSAYISDLNGQIVRTLLNNRPMGERSLINWNGENNQGKLLPEGMYYFVAHVDEFLETKKVMLIY